MGKFLLPDACPLRRKVMSACDGNMMAGIAGRPGPQWETSNL